MNYAWMKLYVEILDDPKMGKMSDALFRSTILVFLVACKNGGSGDLPDVETLAWQLRKPENDVLEILHDLENFKIVGLRDGRHVVINYKKRQDPLTVNERQQRHRLGLTQARHEAVTLTDSESDSDSDTETDKREELDSDSRIERLTKYLRSKNFVVNRKTAFYLKSWLRDFPDEGVVMRAIDDAFEHGAVSAGYIDKIIVTWKVNGLPLTHDEKIVLAKNRNMDRFEVGLKQIIEDENNDDII